MRFGKISPALFLVLMVFLVLVLLVPAALVSAAGTTVSTATLSSSINPSVFGQTITLTATVADADPAVPSGNVIFYDGATSLGTVPLNGGTPDIASLSILNLTVGTHILTATYGGDTTFAVSTSNTVSQVINTAASTVALTSSVNPSVLAQSVIFTAIVTPSSATTGTVQFKIDGTNFGIPVTLSGGSATSGAATSMTVGNHVITAIYSGDTNYTTGTGTLSGGQIVNQASSVTSVASSANPSASGQSLTFTAAVTPNNATGTVQFKIDGTIFGTPVSLSGGSATSVATNTLTFGSHVITAIYSGDTNYTTSTGTLSGGQIVYQTSSATAVTSSVNPSVLAQSVTFTATVSPDNATGTVQFKIDGTNLGAPVSLSGGRATSGAITTLTVGNHTITAVYSGDTTYASSTGTLSGGQIVNSTSASTAVTSSANPSASGQSVTFTATVSPSTATGTVQFTIDGTAFGSAVTLSNGNATSNATTSLTVGNHTVSATYSGDSTYPTNTGTLSGGQTVGTQATITTIALIPGVTGLDYSQTLRASGGSGALTWTRISGSLPSGLALDPSGVITGNPNAAGTYTFTARAIDGAGITASKALTITINDPKYVYAWGSSTYGQLGNNSNTAATTPVGVYAANLITAVAIEAGSQHSLALDPYGSVWAWGNNVSGQLGNRTQTASLLPVQVNISTGAYLSDIVAVNAGSNHSLALKSNGTVWAWGDNSYGQLGDGTSVGKLYAVRVIGLPTSIVAIAAGGNHNLAMTSDGSVWAWGDNSYGQLGNNTVSASNTPLQVSNNTGTGSLSGITAISAGQNHSLALTSDSFVWAWGINTSGQLGNNTLVNSVLPVQVRSSAGDYLNSVSAISAGISHNLALISGSVWAWGENSYGQLGNNTATASSNAVQVKTGISSYLNNIIAISAGQYFNLALSSDGYAWAWGNNDYGQLGNITNTGSPVAIQTLTSTGGYFSNVTAVSAGGSHSLALTRASSITVSISNISFAAGMVGAGYNQTLTASGGNGTYSWSVYSGVLPPGLYLDPSTGNISGAPTTSGSFTFNIRVVSGASTNTQQFTITITQSNPVSITTGSLAGGQVNKAYAATLTATGGSGNYTWYIYSGTLPPGLSLTAATGQISGTPTSAGAFGFQIKVIDSYDSSLTYTTSLSINITPAVTILPVSLSGMTANTPLNIQDGYTQNVSKITTADGLTTLSIPAGIRITDNAGNPLTILSANKITEPPAIPIENALVCAYTFGPAGANFSSPITLTFKFNTTSLPAGVQANNLSVYYYDGAQWSIVQPATIDTNSGTVSAAITHFSVYALMGKITASPVPTQTATPLPTTVQPAPTPVIVTAAPPVKTTPPASSQPVNWGLVIPLILVVLILAVTLFFLIRKKNSMFH